MSLKDSDHVLLVRPTYKDGWDIPGGYVEHGESPRAAAAREVEEELGRTVDVGELLAVDWAPHPEEGDKLLFVFSGGQIATKSFIDTCTLQQAEIAEICFHSPDILPDRIKRRVKSALAGSGPYLESGLRP